MKSKPSAQTRPFFGDRIQPTLTSILTGSRYSAKQKEKAHLISGALNLPNTPVLAAMTKKLNRYAVQPGKIFGTSSRAPDKYKVLRLIMDDVVVQDMQTRRTEVRNINSLLDEWDRKGVKEISFLEELIQTIKSTLGPFLGVFLTAALVSWLSEQLQKNQ